MYECVVKPRGTLLPFLPICRLIRTVVFVLFATIFYIGNVRQDKAPLLRHLLSYHFPLLLSGSSRSAVPNIFYRANMTSLNGSKSAAYGTLKFTNRMGTPLPSPSKKLKSAPAATGVPPPPVTLAVENRTSSTSPRTPVAMCETSVVSSPNGYNPPLPTISDAASGQGTGNGTTNIDGVAYNHSRRRRQRGPTGKASTDNNNTAEVAASSPGAQPSCNSYDSGGTYNSFWSPRATNADVLGWSKVEDHQVPTDDVQLGSHTRRYGGSLGAVPRLSVKVLGMSPLHANLLVARPFVRVWLLDGHTGRNLIKTEFLRSSFGVTHPVDLRCRHTRAPWWGAELLFCVHSSLIEEPSVDPLLLMEVLESGEEAINGVPVPRDGFYPVCWGFLKLRSANGRMNMGKRLNIQMFPFPGRVSVLTRLMQQLPSFLFRSRRGVDGDDIGPLHSQETTEYEMCCASDAVKGNGNTSTPPAIFYTYKRAQNRQVPYAATLLISLRWEDDVSYVPSEAHILPSEECFLDQMPVSQDHKPRSTARSAYSGRPWSTEDKSARYGINTTALGRSYLRNEDERVVPPPLVVQSTQIVGKVTCITFAGVESLMALGVTDGADYLIQLRHALVCGAPIFGVCRGHAGHIHSVTFRRDSQLLLSSSSDKTVRVWRLDNFPSATISYQVMIVPCLCTLPHSFPLYDSVFFESVIVTCGFDPRLFVWNYKEFDNQEVETTIEREQYNHSGAAWQPGRVGSVPLSSTNFNITTAGCGVGQVVYETTGDDGVVVRALSASDRGRLWSVDTLGNVLIWHSEDGVTLDGSTQWRIRTRYRFKCPGATKVEVHGDRALVTCEKHPVAYLIDVMSHQLLHTIYMHQKPYIPVVTLLPDGEAFVACTCDGRLLYWECFSGTLCTPLSGYGAIRTHGSPRRIVWSPNQQLAAVLGSWNHSSLAKRESHSSFMALTIVGAPREEGNVLLRTDAHSEAKFRSRLISGEASPPLTRVSSAGTSESPLWATAGQPQSSRPVGAMPSSIFESKSSRIDNIVAVWKQLTSRHRCRRSEEPPFTANSGIDKYVAENV
ncbi:hypothetical protein, conserved [Trypanosoma brucei gambiense DAL972]|uniref:Uncharacterized protein n=1 Tax=Trypanosoma brucei gambiense (strain MHOM/CI/86/DAL972) TaxID=679716 RepID=D0A9X5_TRYB9|nr:hypothetical protein, conserved [Trypanosoma brucei gambiense DAL972]CBH18476.1 hypothetical protein, conserved [Trypanosoma brucei gambiense DAL972]|eukprot:XP_011780740.1 hypothetical protein, conserved [Trypanosoma brucei gambiense DAL972]